MVCVRCKMAVQAVLEENNTEWVSIELGRMELKEELTAKKKELIAGGLKRFELDILEDKKLILTERIKTEIITLLHLPDRLQLKLSAHLSRLFEYNYTYLSNIFSEQEGISLERFFITQRIERVKELLLYADLSLTDIADEMNYSSVAHLSLQFKKVTGLTPAVFRKDWQTGIITWQPL